MVTLLPPTSEAGVWFPAWPQVGKLVVACRWSGVYSTEPLYVLVSSALPTTRCDMTCTVLKVTIGNTVNLAKVDTLTTSEAGVWFPAGAIRDVLLA